MKALQDKVMVEMCLVAAFLLSLQVQAYEEKIDTLEKDVAEHKEEITGLKTSMAEMTG